MNTIFTITSIVHVDGEKGTSQRCFGWYPKLAEAQAAVKANLGDLEEALYNWLVIEQYEPGIHAMALSEHWYEWIEGEDGGSWERASKPSWSIGTVNWAIG